MSIYQYFKAKKCVGRASREDIYEAERVARDYDGADAYNGFIHLAFLKNLGPIHQFLFQRIGPDGRDFGHQNRALPRLVLAELTNKMRLALNTRDETIIPEYNVRYMDNIGYDKTRYWDRLEQAFPVFDKMDTASNTLLKGWSLCYEPQY